MKVRIMYIATLAAAFAGGLLNTGMSDGGVI